MDLLKSILEKHWSRETSYYSDWTEGAPSSGQCAITALKVQELLGGDIAKTKVGDMSHYFNMINGAVVDITKGQFGQSLSYESYEKVDAASVISNPDTKRRYDIFSEKADKELDAPLSLNDTAHISIRQPFYVAGTREFPEVKIFCQTNKKAPFAIGKLAPGQEVYMKWVGGPIVAKSKILSWSSGVFNKENINEVHDLTTGTRLYGLDEYWSAVAIKKSGYFNVIRLKDEEWLSELVYPSSRSFGSSWIILDTLRKKIIWLSNKIEPEDCGTEPGRAIPASLRFFVLRRDGFTCRYCGRKAPDVELHVDHVVPWVKVREHKIENLVAACRDCNLGKSDKPL